MTQRSSAVVQWYRTPLAPELLKQLRQRSDALGLLQSLGYLGLLVLTGSLAFYAAGHWPWPVTVLLVYLHGTCYAFQINAVHELGHCSVFRSPRLNQGFEHVFAFLGWINFRAFTTSHVRHHDYTLHPPDDLEVVLPIRIARRAFFDSFLKLNGPYRAVKETLRLARGQFRGEWELKLFPADDLAKRFPVMRWARTVLVGHALIVVAAATAALTVDARFWLIPLLVTFAPYYGGWLFFLCNSTQHIGLKDNVPDFRLCCRTSTLNPIVQFLYWHMNYHTEHHMYPMVPCYRLGRLHRAIRHDLPPCPQGIIATWREIAAIQARQDREPGYQHAAPLPANATATS